MKKIALSLGASAVAFTFLAVAPGVSSSAVLLAQDSTARPTPANPSPSATGQQATEIPAQFKPLFEGITLTDTQNQQVAQIAARYATPAGSDSAKAGMGAGAVDQRMAAAKEFRAVLTPDQQKTFDKNLDKAKASWGGKKNY